MTTYETLLSNANSIVDASYIDNIDAGGNYIIHNIAKYYNTLVASELKSNLFDELMIKYDYNINKLNSTGQNAILVYIEHNAVNLHVEFINKMITYGINLNVIDSTNNNLLTTLGKFMSNKITLSKQLSEYLVDWIDKRSISFVLENNESMSFIKYSIQKKCNNLVLLLSNYFNRLSSETINALLTYAVETNINSLDYIRNSTNYINTIESENKENVLHLCIKNSIDISRFLRYNININHQDSSGYTPLILACKLKNESAAYTLINENADINMQDNSGKTAIMYCCDNYMTSISKKIIDLYVYDEELCLNACGSSNLIYACSTNSHEIVTYMISKVHNINVVNNAGDTALILSTKLKKALYVRLLLDKGADKTIINNAGNTAAQEAVAVMSTLCLEIINSY